MNGTSPAPKPLARNGFRCIAAGATLASTLMGAALGAVSAPGGGAKGHRSPRKGRRH